MNKREFFLSGNGRKQWLSVLLRSGYLVWTRVFDVMIVSISIAFSDFLLVAFWFNISFVVLTFSSFLCLNSWKAYLWWCKEYGLKILQHKWKQLLSSESFYQLVCVRFLCWFFFGSQSQNWLFVCNVCRAQPSNRWSDKSRCCPSVCTVSWKARFASIASMKYFHYCSLHWTAFSLS